MTELARHIEILLLNNDCVIVPGFGGFMTHHTSAVYSDEEGIFLPPSRSLGFNPQLTINDSLLAQSYVEAYDISYPEALRRIEDDVNELRQNINNNGNCSFDNIGTISLNDEGNYDFEPIEAGTLTPSLYALSSFEMPKLLNESKKIVKAVDSETEIESEEDNYKEEKSNEFTISINIATAKRVAMAAAVLLLLLLVSIPIGDGLRNTSNTCSIDTSIFTQLMPSVEVNGNTNTFELQVPKKENANVESQAKTEPEKVETPSDSYVLVLASYVSRHNADDFVAKLKKSGINDARVTENGARKVVCGNYSTESAAYAGMNKLIATGIISDAWVLHIK